MQSIHDYYGELVFSRKVMEQKLSKNIFKKLTAAIDNLEPLDQSIAGEVAHAMKEWALENGATHFTHWFQPQRGGTAQKHDSFIDYGEHGEIIERFSASQLVQSEPDASSFPSGGIRSTFEARGYTAWDPTSPVFLLEAGKTKTLVIPSVFLSWTGEVLDLKTPFLRSLSTLNEKVINLQKFLGNKNAKQVKVYAGIEQEYFLLSKELVKSRPDITVTGRTIFGAQPAKGQQMEDHYFGNIKGKVLEFMEDVDHQLYRKGIPIKTRHNEVAPNQFELAPLHQEANLAIDNNLQIMEILKKVAAKHNMVALLHEKPFSGVNGSGKHFNWSIGDNTGTNYFEPSKSPLKNVSFLLAISAVLLGVKKFGGVLRATVADAGNDHRLGANEAPPAIMSVYLGDYVSEILDSIEKTHTINEKAVNEITLGVQNLPKVNKDYSDRNRTSPVAFTGNKFEFRALGSSSNPAEAGTVLNFIAAYGFDEIYKRIETKKGDGDVKKKALEVIKEILVETKDIRFEKNGYSQDWHKEAQKRGLPNAKNTPAALKLLLDNEVVKTFAKYGILTERELKSKVEIKLENYIKTKEIEYRYSVKVANTLMLPAILKQINALAKASKNLNKLDIKSDSFEKELKTLINIYDEVKKLVAEMETFLALEHKDVHETAEKFASQGVEILAKLRGQIDSAEDLVADEFWPMASYQKLLTAF
ncbi:glutamine synthetase III [Candidatus Endomicrobiellum devescovinae]|jgi:glutamine synthetase|uniref:glutamine synthetase III family protein n=1 Tax=Candidatus Endomicrobiellum devescovinae TaxID=3242322 RepID=UPI0028246FEC|nr:glutamine synthetase III [Endomicrobium sp.]